MLSLIPAFSLMDSTFFTGSIISPELLKPRSEAIFLALPLRYTEKYSHTIF